VAKINRVSRMIDCIKPECDLEVHGRIDPETARLCVKAGANVLVIGLPVVGNSSGVTTAMGATACRLACLKVQRKGVTLCNLEW
jgi:pentose-5-phosphate-3-epimerase